MEIPASGVVDVSQDLSSVQHFLRFRMFRAQIEKEQRESKTLKIPAKSLPKSDFPFSTYHTHSRKALPATLSRSYTDPKIMTMASE